MGKNQHRRVKNRHIFLSYRSTEVDFALRLAADLKNAGVNLWMDRLDIKPGDDWLHALQRGVNSCAAMIAVLSPEYVSSKYCQREMARADRMGRPIFPVLLHPITAEDWPFEVERSQYIDFSEWEDEGVYQNRLSETVAILKEEAAGHVHDVPDPETRYLTSLIAELEARKGVLEYVELAAQADALSGIRPIRPKPRLDETWGVSGAVAVLEQPSAKKAQKAAQEPASKPRKQPLKGIREAVERYHRFVLIGASGAGKTTIIERLALDAAQSRRDNPRSGSLPLLLRLADWEDGLDAASFVAAHWQFGSDPAKALAKGDVFLYLDGLNEMGPTGPQKAQALAEWLHSKKAPKYAIVTCRTADYGDELNLSLPTIMAEAMDVPRVKRFVTNYLDEDAAKVLLERILPQNRAERADKHHIFRLSSNPFLLTVLMRIYPDGDLPVNMGTLFGRLVHELWERERVRKTPGWVPYDEMEQAFSALAFAMIEADMPYSAPREAALEHLGDERLLRMGGSANILTIEADKVRFYHPMMQEYFAAVQLHREGLFTRLMQPRFDQWGNRISRKWDPVFAALIGVVHDPNSAVRNIAEVDPFLAVECMSGGVAISDATHDWVVERLTNAMHLDHRDGRVAAARVLAELDEKAVAPILLDAMRTGTWEIRQTAYDRLKEVETLTLPGLVEALTAWDQDMKEATAVALWQLGTEALPVLLGLLDNDEWALRRAAAWALGEMKDMAAVPGLLAALHDEEHLVRKEAIHALGMIRDVAAVPELLDTLRDENWRVSKAAAHTLGLIGAPAVPGLVENLNDDNVNVRRLVAQALGVVGGAEVVPSLIKGLEDTNVDVRGAAAEGLARIAEPKATPALIAALNDKAKPRWGKLRICDIAVEGLERIGTAEALSAVGQWRSGVIVASPQPTTVKQNGSAKPPGETTHGPTAVAVKERLARMKNKMIGERPAAPPPARESLSKEDEEKVVAALRAADSQTRLKAMSSLHGGEGAAIIKELLRLLQADDHMLRDAAGESLTRYGTAAVPGLVAALQHNDVNVRAAAVEALGKIGDPVAIDALVACLPDVETPWMAEGRRICDLAIAALERIGSAKAQAVVRRWHGDSSSGGERTPAFRDGRHRGIVSELIVALHDENWGVQQDAAKALRDYAKVIKGSKDREVLEPLSQALQDSDWVVRWAAAEALAWIGNRETVKALSATLQDENWMVRVAAIRALLEIGDVSAAAELAILLGDEHYVVREVTAEALGVMGVQATVPNLVVALDDHEIFVRREAVEALGSIGDSTAVPGLVKALREDGDENVRWAAAEALGKICDVNAVSGLIERLTDTAGPHWEERRICDVVADALECIGTPEAQAAVNQWRQNKKLARI